VSRPAPSHASPPAAERGHGVYGPLPRDPQGSLGATVVATCACVCACVRACSFREHVRERFPAHRTGATEVCAESETGPGAAVGDTSEPNPGADVGGGAPSPGADVGGASPARVQPPWETRAQSWSGMCARLVLGRAQSRCVTGVRFEPCGSGGGALSIRKPTNGKAATARTSTLNEPSPSCCTTHVGGQAQGRNPRRFPRWRR
jgi:hypothetical protein